MWLLSYMTRNSMEKPSAERGNLSRGAEGNVVRASGEHKAFAQCLPYGVYSVAPAGSRMVVIPLSDGEAALDVNEHHAELEPGELALYSKGGASVVLKNSGDVLINGQVFARD